jgi:hypothetical protein
MLIVFTDGLLKTLLEAFQSFYFCLQPFNSLILLCFSKVYLVFTLQISLHPIAPAGYPKDRQALTSRCFFLIRCLDLEVKDVANWHF